MTKMKLCPIEPSDEILNKGQNVGAWTKEARKENSKAYKAMIDCCPTIEVVDIETIKKKWAEPSWGNEEEDPWDCPDTHQEFGEMVGWNKCLKYLTQNGYMIVRKRDD